MGNAISVKKKIQKLHMAIAICVKKIDKNCKVEREEKEREKIEREERKISTPAVLFSLTLGRPHIGL